MSFDEQLAERVRQALSGRTGIVERSMFGGPAFLLHGRMAVGVHGDDLIVRVGDPGSSTVDVHDARPFDLTGRPMRGWVLVAGDGLATERLEQWVREAIDVVSELPPK